MIFSLLAVGLLCTAAFAFWQLRSAAKSRVLASRPLFYGVYTFLFQGTALIIVWLGGFFFLPSLCTTALTVTFMITWGISLWRLSPHFHARKWVEGWIKMSLRLCALIAILITLAIGLTLATQAFRFFRLIPLDSFLLGAHWSPTTGLFGTGASFGAIPLFSGTLLITVIAMIVAAPLGILSALYLSQYASKAQRHLLKPLLEILAGIPTIVYGFVAVMAVSPFLKKLCLFLGIEAQAENALGAGLVMGIMIMPYMSALSEDVLRSVPRHLKDASLAMGVTEAETVRHVVLPTAFPGLMSAFLLSVSRAIGETMLVVMALGLTAKLTANPLETVTTVTVQIVSLLTGDQAFDSAGPLSAFALGLVLFMMTLGLNVMALRIIKKQQRRVR